MITKSADIWVTWAIRNKRSIFFYDNRVLDLTEFAYLHPGGKKSIENLKYKDVTNTLFKVFPHDRQSTLQRLSRYVIGIVEQQMVRHQEQQLSLIKSKQQQSLSKKKVCFQKKSTNKLVQYYQSEDSNFLEKQSQGLLGKQKVEYNRKNDNSNRENRVANNNLEISIQLNLVESEDIQNQMKTMDYNQPPQNPNWFDMSFDNEQMQEHKKELNFPYLLVKEKAIL